MNNLTVTLELCTEDRARLDKILEALQKTPNCDSCVKSAIEYTPAKMETKAKAEDLAEAPKNEPQATEAPAKAETLPWEETPAAEEKPKAEPTVTQEQIRQKVIQLSATEGGKKKAQARSIVTAYSETISGIPDDKCTEVWEKLLALESEV